MRVGAEPRAADKNDAKCDFFVTQAIPRASNLGLNPAFTGASPGNTPRNVTVGSLPPHRRRALPRAGRRRKTASGLMTDSGGLGLEIV